MTAKDKILKELDRGNRYAFELKEAAQIEYKQLWLILNQLEQEGKIERYYRDTPPSATIAFRIPESARTKSWWGR